MSVPRLFVTPTFSMRAVRDERDERQTGSANPCKLVHDSLLKFDQLSSKSGCLSEVGQRCFLTLDSRDCRVDSSVSRRQKNPKIKYMPSNSGLASFAVKMLWLTHLSPGVVGACLSSAFH
jgi:hypothetical protein